MSARWTISAYIVLAAHVMRAIAVGDVVLVGPQIEASSVSLFGDVVPAVAAFPQGGFVIAWSENLEFFPKPPLRAEVMVRRFNRDGVALASEFVVNTYTTGWQGFPVLDAWPCGFVIGWESDPMNGMHRQFGGVRRYDTFGAPLEDEIRFSDVADDPVLAADSRGGFAVAWSAYDSAERKQYSLLRRFDHADHPGNAFDISDDGSSVWFTGIAALTDGTSVVVFADGGARARRFDRQGAPLGPAFAVSENGGGLIPEVVADALGGFAVVWMNDAQTEIIGRRFAAAGEPAGAEFSVARLDEESTFDSFFPGPRPIAMSASGDLLVVWKFATASDVSGVAAQHIDSRGRRLGPAAIINMTTAGLNLSPSVATDTDGNFIVVWTYYYGIDLSVRAQRVNLDPQSTEHPAAAAYCPGDCDGNNQIDNGEITDAERSLFDGQAPCRCPALDADSDHRATAADLVSSVSAAIAGCPVAEPSALDP